MRVIDMLNCSRRMFFENAVEGFEYTGRGTCFLCRYRDQDFIVALSHVIDGYAADALRVFFYQGARDFLPHNAQLSIKCTNDAGEENPDWAQIMLYPLEQSLYSDADFANEVPYPIPDADCVWRPSMGGQFIMRGFPHDRSYIDYDNAILSEQAVILEAELAGPSSMPFCYEIKFKDLSPCTTLDGLSGTPVFWIGEEQPRDHRFAGVMVRATHTSGIGHFIHAEVVLAALEKALQS